VRVEGTRWRAIAPVTVEGAAREVGEIGDGVTLAIGAYRVKLAPSPAGAVAATPQRTESLARELVRSMLGTGGAPTLELERGPAVGARRMLAPPESVLVIGRGDEAGWIIDDGDLSRAHCEVRRGWDGVRIVDLGSKNGTNVDGRAVGGEGASLHDGASIELGKVVLRFRDPAERHLRGEARVPRAAEIVEGPQPRASALPFYAAIAIILIAFAGLVWIVAS
jgi:hypothetical protein